MLVNKQLLEAIDLHGIFLYYASQWLPAATVWLTKYLLLCSTEQNTCIQVWNIMRVSKR